MFEVFGNATTAAPLNWQPEPSTRGTWSILSTCLITLGLCLWTALHLNIPEHRKESSQKWRKCRWLVTGLLAPEMVAYTAWYQRKAAMRLNKAMIDLLGQCDGEDPDTPLRAQNADIEMRTCETPRKLRYPWTINHSFYAIMGGFAFDTSDARPNFLPGSRSRVCINLRGLHFIAKEAPDLIPDISEQEIKDKSKANGLAKFLVCLQALRFCVQCITRLAEGQAISLLELNAFGHSVCTLSMYALRWHKPFEIGEASLLQGEKSWEMCALLCMITGAQYPHTDYPLVRYDGGLLYEKKKLAELQGGAAFGELPYSWFDTSNGLNKHYWFRWNACY